MDTLPFNSRDIEYKYPFGAVRTGSFVSFTIRPHRRFAVTNAYLMLQKDGGSISKIPLKWLSYEGTCDVYTYSFTPQETGLFWYSFILECLDGLLYIRNTGTGQGEIAGSSGAVWQLTVFDRGFSTPDWLKGGTIYQIFPDRFYRDSIISENVPKDRDIREDWGGQVEYKSFETLTRMNNDYFGGNLAGITARLDYLSGLGVTVIYLNPIFEAQSNHRYNTADYMKIDPLLGTEEDFRKLCSKASEYGIKIILDGVFNHTGDDSIYFNRYGRYEEPGAYQSETSRFRDWYNFINWPEEYKCWWGIDSLPQTNKDNKAYQEYILGDNGVLAYWLKAGAGGWRLDVADELPSFFLDEIRNTVKKCDSDAVIIGEVWEDASNKISYDERRHYLEGYELDSIMNYPFKEGIIRFIKDHNSYELNNLIMSILENYPKPVVDVLMNMLGTHDTSRILTRLQGESSDGKDRNWKALKKLSEEERAIGLKEVALAAAILYFLPGLPCIYYGDETGLEGYEDPFNRGCFIWERTDYWLTDWFKKLGNIRRSHPVLREGNYSPFKLENGFFSFIRKAEDEKSLLCAVNLDDKSHSITIPYDEDEVKLLASLDGNTTNPILEIPPVSCRIYQLLSMD